MPDSGLSTLSALRLFAAGAFGVPAVALTYLTRYEAAVGEEEIGVVLVLMILLLANSLFGGAVYCGWLRMRRLKARWQHAYCVPLAAGALLWPMSLAIYALSWPVSKLLPGPLGTVLDTAFSYAGFVVVPVVLAEVSVRLLRFAG